MAQTLGYSLHGSLAGRHSGGAMSLPFDSQAGLIVVPVRLWGPDTDTIAHLALDTGATGSLVNWDIAVLLGYERVT